MSSSPRCSLLGLPREVRDLIYTTLFRSLLFDAIVPHPVGGDSGPDQRLAILRVSRQIYHEASPLVLRHVRIFCGSAVDMLRALMAMSPAQVRQLKHLRVHYDMLRLNVPRQAREEEGEAGARDHDDLAPWPCGFHVGALLGLFPGLELDLLELTDGIHDGISAFRSYHAPDVISSLLRAAGGYREVRATFTGLNCCFPGSFADHSQDCFRADAPQVLDAMAELIRTRFRSPGSAVEMYFDDEAPADEGYWDRHREAGFTLHEGLEARDEEGSELAMQGGDEMDCWNFRACRGDGPWAVPEGDGEVLECVHANPMTFDELREVSGYLRGLVSEGDWARIRQLQAKTGMLYDGPYDGDRIW